MKTLTKFVTILAAVGGLVGLSPTVTLAQEAPDVPGCEHCEAPTWYVDCIRYSNTPDYYVCTRYEKQDGQWVAVLVWWKLYG